MVFFLGFWVVVDFDEFWIACVFREWRFKGVLEWVFGGFVDFFFTPLPSLKK